MPCLNRDGPCDEFLGVVEETGSDVTGVKRGDMVAPFTYCDNTCDYCRKGLHSSC